MILYLIKIVVIIIREAIIDSDKKQIYEDKIKNIKVILETLESKNEFLKEKMNCLNQELSEKQKLVKNLYEKIDDLKKNNYTTELIAITKKINQLRQEMKEKEKLKEELISKQAVLSYKKKNTTTVFEDRGILETKIKLLDKVITVLDKKRFENSKTILNSLKELMLNGIHNFGLNSITDIEINQKFNIIYTQNGFKVKFDDIVEKEKLRVKLAFYLALIQLDIDKNQGRHTHFLIIDSPNKEEGDNFYLKGLSEILKQIEEKYGNNLQILIGTATHTFWRNCKK